MDELEQRIVEVLAKTLPAGWSLLTCGIDKMAPGISRLDIMVNPNLRDTCLSVALITSILPPAVDDIEEFVGKMIMSRITELCDLFPSKYQGVAQPG